MSARTQKLLKFAQPATNVSSKPTSRPKKQNKADFLRSWGLPYPSFQYHHLRYKSPPEKGVYWYYFSLFVRERDVREWGRCISCLRPITMQNSQAGHFMPAADCGRDLLFDPRNVNAECEHCNAWDSTHLLGYAENLDLRYGKGTAGGLRIRRNEYKASNFPIRDWTRLEYVEKIKELPTYAQRRDGVLP